MYSHHSIPYGPYQMHTVASGKSGHSLSLIPDCGGVVMSLELSGHPLLDGYQNLAELTSHEWYKNEWLFPFANRLRDGSYNWNGKKLHFPVNEPKSNTALHGFGAGKKFTLADIALHTSDADLILVHENNGDSAAYPFAFRLKIGLQLSDKDGLTVNMAFENTGRQFIPAVMGWHSYFKLGGKLDDWQLKMPTCQKVEVDSRMLPTGKRSLFNNFDILRSLEGFHADHCFAIEAVSAERFAIELASPKGQLQYWQEVGLSGFEYVQLFTVPSREAIAIEPVTANIDAFNNWEGLAFLAPGESLEGRFGIRFDVGES